MTAGTAMRKSLLLRDAMKQDINTTNEIPIVQYVLGSFGSARMEKKRKIVANTPTTTITVSRRCKE